MKSFSRGNFFIFCFVYLAGVRLNCPAAAWNKEIYTQVLEGLNRNESQGSLREVIKKNKTGFDRGYSAETINWSFAVDEKEALNYFEELYRHVFVIYKSAVWPEYFGYFTRLLLDVYNPFEFSYGARVSGKVRENFKINQAGLILDFHFTEIKNIKSFRSRLSAGIWLNSEYRDKLISEYLSGSNTGEQTKKIARGQLQRAVELLDFVWSEAADKLSGQGTSKGKASEYFYLGMLYLENCGFNNSETVFKELLSKFPDKTVAYYGLAQAYIKNGFDDLAVDVLFAWLEKNIVDTENYFIIREKTEIKEQPRRESRTLITLTKKDLLSTQNLKKFSENWIEIDLGEDSSGFIEGDSGILILDRPMMYYILATSLEKLKGKSILYKEAGAIWKMLIDSRFSELARKHLSKGD